MKLIVGNLQVILVISPLCSLVSRVYHITAHDSQDATGKVVCVCEKQGGKFITHFVCLKWETGFCELVLS